MLSLIIAAQRATGRFREGSMRRAVVAYINEALGQPSHSLLARRVASFGSTTSLSPAHTSRPHLTTSGSLKLTLSDSQHESLYCSDGFEVLQLSPRPTVSMAGWTFYLDSDGAVEDNGELSLWPGEDLFLLVEAFEIADVTAFVAGHQQWWRPGAVKLESLCRCVAWRGGSPFSMILACSRANLERVVDAYLSDRLITDDQLTISQMVVIRSTGRPSDLIRTDSSASVTSTNDANRTSPPPPPPPPNVVVYDAADPDSATVHAVIGVLKETLDPDSYVIHRLSADAWESGVWRHCTRLLVCLGEHVGDRKAVSALRQSAMSFVNDLPAGVLLLLPSDEELSEEEMEEVEEGWTHVELGRGAPGRMLCLRDSKHLTTASRMTALLRIVGLDCCRKRTDDADPDTEPPFFLSAERNLNRWSQEVLQLFPLLLLRLSPPGACPGDDRKEGRLLVPWAPRENGVVELRPSFRFDLIFKGRESFRKPVVLLHSDVISSSWTLMSEVFSRLPTNCTFVMSSRQQTTGRGRGDNTWISPVGQMQMTFHCSVALNSPLGQASSLVQHLAALAVVMAVRDLTRQSVGEVDIGVRLKWPNDIYWVQGDNAQKLGGLLTRATFKGDEIVFLIGMGINVSNKKPTVCLHDAMSAAGVSANQLPPIELVMRHVLLHMQTWISDLESRKLSLDSLRQKYESWWMHSGQKVSVTQADGHTVTNCRILGIDQNGYLLVQEMKEGGEVCSIHPDGNSFDLLKNLIRPK